MAMTIFMQGSKWDIDVKNRHLDSVGEGEGGMIWEYSIEKCILSYVKKMKQGTQSQCSETAWRDGVGGEVAGEVLRIWGHMCTRGWFMLIYAKRHHYIIKELPSN